MAFTTSPLLLDRVPFWAIVVTNLGAAFVFAGIYAACGVYWPGHGLVPLRNDAPIQWHEYLYFSFVTQTTIGYGDLLPLGFSRLFACLQAGAGVVSTGLLIAKITTASISRYNLLRKE